MCKFHILGVCAKGSSCRFAHAKEELQHLPDLARTKLCKALINTGSCDNPECTYAHNKDELRMPPVPDAPPRRPGKPYQQQQQHQDLPQQPVPPPQQQHQQHQQQHQQLQQQQQQLQQQLQQLQQLQQQVQKQVLGSDGHQQTYAPHGGATAPADFDLLLQQMGQVAQAHALEAARLQAMAMQMHGEDETSSYAAMGGDSGLMPYLSLGAGQAYAQAPQQQPQPQSQPQSQSQSQSQPQLQPQSQPQPQHLPVPSQSPMMVAHPDPDVKAGSPSGSPARDASQQTLASAMSRMLGSEPVTIRTENLRSMSSNSLCRMAMEDDDEEENHQMPDLSLKQMEDVNVQDGAELALDRRMQALGLSDALDTGAITVKNTFLDFAPPTSALRSVRTAGGRLDLLGQWPSTASLDVLGE
mmetsp:Transcript_62803/g.158974  ORF Transcript_62803/g.158974 Transcript_62803/m.158974 type:complete len:412 (+) Transcript_62803:1-1236(+)